MNEELHNYIGMYLEEVAEISHRLSHPAISKIVEELIALRRAGGRLFILGVGGSAANASHAVNDFRKIADIESYTPTDNAAELTARINDDGWDSSYAAWLRVSRLSSRDALLVLSVGGGNEQKRVSLNLIEAIRLARSWCKSPWNRGTGWRLYGPSRRRMRANPYCERSNGNSAH